MITLSDLIRSDIQQQAAYVVADVPDDFIKLDAMELPYRFPAKMQQEWMQELAQAAINRYPNPATCGLQAALRTTFAIPEAAQIALGNGSDELIQLLTMLLAKPNAVMMAVEPSFVMYRHNAALFGMRYVGVPLHDDFTLNLPAMLAAIEQHQPALIFLAYPNNPTGVPFARAEVEAIIAAASGVVVIDEAYGSFSSDSFLPQAGSHEKLVVLRTLSKVGFAGLRIGYACGHPHLMTQLAKIIPPYNMNQLSLTSAKFALRHYDWVSQQITILKQERQQLSHALTALAGYTVFPSEANFITVRVPHADEVFNVLKEHKILIKNLHNTHPLLNQCLRFTVGTPTQNQQVLNVLHQIV